MRRVMTGAIVAAMTSALAAEPELKGTPSELSAYLGDIPQSVYITGKGEVKVDADEAQLCLSIKTEAKLLAEALAKNQEQRTAIEKTLIRKGVPQEKIKSQKFSSTPEHRILSDKVQSYAVSTRVDVTVKNQDQFRTVAALIDSLPYVDYAGVEFRHSATKEQESAALEKACAEAEKKKAVYEKTLGVTLIPRSFSEGVYAPEPPMLRPRMAMAMDKMKQEVLEEESPPPPSFDQLIYTATVTVEYRLIPKARQ
jgi:uncharacterized protein YggE